MLHVDANVEAKKNNLMPLNVKVWK
jgi:hypothetical protein